MKKLILIFAFLFLTACEEKTYVYTLDVKYTTGASELFVVEVKQRGFTNTTGMDEYGSLWINGSILVHGVRYYKIIDFKLKEEDDEQDD